MAPHLTDTNYTDGQEYTNGHEHSNGNDKPVVNTDILIVGSGPIGATYARKLVDAGIKVLMVEIGAQETPIPGDHKKNNYVAQKNVNNFIKVIQGELDLLSVSIDKQSTLALDPSSWSVDPHKSTIANGQNPEQDEYKNLPAAAATRIVGGMGSHWTCCTPRQHPKLERSTLFSDEEWDKLYDEAEQRIKTTSTIFEDSVRQQLVKRILEKFDYGNGDRDFISMPLAVEKRPLQTYLEWSCSATVFGDIAKNNNLFELRSQTRCTKLIRSRIPGALKEIEGALCKDLKTGREYVVKAKKYIICAGAVLTPGILFNSGWTPETEELPALGRYLTEQTMCFCQVVLSRDLVNSVHNDPFGLGWDTKVEKHCERYPNDPLPFPFSDPDPQVYTPVSEAYPWHTQIHRDAFSYGQVPASVDQRLIVDLRWFGWIVPEYTNRVTFSDKMTDAFGMPQPTFEYRVPRKDAERSHRMMADMCLVASKLGGFLPGAEPKFLVPGSALHISGTTRAGINPADSVCDRFGKVWGVDDLYVGGCSVIPTGAACNPTLTAMCFAIASADKIIENWSKSDGIAAKKTEKSEV